MVSCYTTSGPSNKRVVKEQCDLTFETVLALARLDTVKGSTDLCSMVNLKEKRLNLRMFSSSTEYFLVPTPFQVLLLMVTSSST